MIKFDKPIYKVSAVRAAAKDFSEFATFSIENGTECIMVGIDNVQPDLKENFAGEFGNYVIGMMK
ncbi:MAG: HxsD-like protein [bacterium]